MSGLKVGDKIPNIFGMVAQDYFTQKKNILQQKKQLRLGIGELVMQMKLYRQKIHHILSYLLGFNSDWSRS